MISDVRWKVKAELLEFRRSLQSGKRMSCESRMLRLIRVHLLKGMRMSIRQKLALICVIGLIGCAHHYEGSGTKRLNIIMGDYGVPDVVEESAGDELRRYRPLLMDNDLLLPWPESTVVCYYLSKNIKVESRPSAAFDTLPITEEERTVVMKFLKECEERERKKVESPGSQRGGG